MFLLATVAFALAFALATGAYAVARVGVDPRSALVIATVLLAAGGTVAQVAPLDADRGPAAPSTAVAADRQSSTPAAEAAAITAAPAASTPTTTTATVVGVVSGDRLTYRSASGTRTVSLAGVDAPDVGGDDPQQFDGVLTGSRGRRCLADQGRRTLVSLRSSLRGTSVTVRPVATTRGTTRALVTVDGRSVNRRLVERGQARATDDRYADAERTARSARRGVWSCGIVSPDRPLREENGTDVRIAAVHPNPPGDDAAALDDEFVVVENTGRETVDLSNWYLTDDDGNYYFFGGPALAPGERLVLHVGSGANTDGHVYWNAHRPVLDNDHETLKLVDGTTERVVRLSY